MNDDKKTAYEQTIPVDGGERAFADPQWRTGVFTRFPWMGFGALFTVLVCAASAVLVLILSDGKSQTSQWPEKIAPNVILSGLNSVSNICFGIAIGNGVAIAWWRKTLKGSTISDLHRSWSFSTSFKDLLLSGKYFNFIALAALTAKLTIIDSMLLQRATTTVVATDDRGRNLTAIYGWSNETIPFTAELQDRSGTTIRLDTWFATHLDRWSKVGGFYQNSYAGCDGVCYTHVPGAGFEFDCSSNTTSIDYGNSSHNDLMLSMASDGSAVINNTYSLFNVTFDVDYRDGVTEYDDGIEYSRLIMNILSSSATSNSSAASGVPSCPGTITQHTCYLRPAIIGYPVTIRDTRYDHEGKPQLHPMNDMSLGFNSTPADAQNGSNTLTDYHPTQKQQDNFFIYDHKDVLEDHITVATPETQLGGLKQALTQYLGGSSVLTFDGITGYSQTQAGLSQSRMTYTPADRYECGIQYEDPVNYIVQQVNSLMFTISLNVFDKNPDIDALSTLADTMTSEQLGYKELLGIEFRDEVYYKTVHRYMWGAVASMMVCVLCVLPSYYGYWQLGRNVTLGPFEIANAFRAPVLDHPDVSNAVVKELIRGVGDRQVKYGEMVTNDAPGRLAIAEPEAVRRVHPPVSSARQEIDGHIGRVMNRL